MAAAPSILLVTICLQILPPVPRRTTLFLVGGCYFIESFSEQMALPMVLHKVGMASPHHRHGQALTCKASMSNWVPTRFLHSNVDLHKDFIHPKRGDLTTDITPMKSFHIS